MIRAQDADLEEHRAAGAAEGPHHVVGGPGGDREILASLAGPDVNLPPSPDHPLAGAARHDVVGAIQVVLENLDVDVVASGRGHGTLVALERRALAWGPIGTTISGKAPRLRGRDERFRPRSWRSIGQPLQTKEPPSMARNVFPFAPAPRPEVLPEPSVWSQMLSTFQRDS